jgi:hypothetical protein
MGFTTPADVNNIVLANIGGMPQMPATDTLIDGRVVTPQIGSVCSLGDSISSLSGQISDALHNFMQGLDDLVINPLSALGTAVLQQIQTVLSYIQGLLATASAALTTALNLAVAALSAATAAVTAIVSFVGNMISTGLQQILGSLSACQPSNTIPAAKTYGADDLASSLKQQPAIQNLQVQVNAIQGTLIDTTTTEDQKITALNSISGNVTSGATTLNNSVSSDTNNLAAAQLQNQGLGKMTTLANGLNNPATSGFVSLIINPARAGMIQGIAEAMPNAPKTA